MSVLDLIKNENAWQDFYEYKLEKGHLSKKEIRDFEVFINNKKYEDISFCVKDKDFFFCVPTKKVINKLGTNKKRIVYCYSEDESMILKFISYHLLNYDHVMSSNCYSFRKNYGVKKAIDRITSHKNIKDMVSYKLDIKNYFNSIDVDKLIVMLEEIIDDEELLKFLIKLLKDERVVFNDEIINEKRGAMAGVPISPFLANVYLRDLDKYFEDNNILYARYSDDIIVFANTEEELQGYVNYINKVINEKGLSVNKEKEYFFKNGESWNFLGVQYKNGKIDLSKVTVDKIKGKIRRKARAIYRWKIRNKVEDEKAIRVLARCFNRKFFDATDSNDLTWSRWFFCLINTDEGLRKVDQYLQYYLRYVATGKHNKANYRIKYKDLKECNYRSLVNEFYKNKNDSSLSSVN